MENMVKNLNQMSIGSISKHIEINQAGNKIPYKATAIEVSGSLASAVDLKLAHGSEFMTKFSSSLPDNRKVNLDNIDLSKCNANVGIVNGNTSHNCVQDQTMKHWSILKETVMKKKQ